MRAVEDWLSEYGESHRNGINKAVHWVCVPLIVFSVIGLLWSIPVPASWHVISPLLNFGTVFIAAAVVYYFFLSPPLALGMLFVSVAVIAVLSWLEGLVTPVWEIATGIFIVSWLGQFIGHVFEGRRPSFLKDVQFLLIGPIWLLAALYRSLRIPYRDRQHRC
jgi:uncharacterized membrane protein YGL010W